MERDDIPRTQGVVRIETHARATLLDIEKDKSEIRERRAEEETRRRVERMQLGDDEMEIDLPAASQIAPKSTSTIEGMYTDHYGFDQPDAEAKTQAQKSAREYVSLFSSVLVLGDFALGSGQICSWVHKCVLSVSHDTASGL